MRTNLLPSGVVLLLFVAMARGQGQAKKDLSAAKAIIAEYALAQREFLTLLRDAKTPEERADALALRPEPSDFAKRMLAVAKRDPKSSVAGEALLWITTTAPNAPETKAAIGLLFEHQAGNAALTPDVLVRLSFDPYPQLDKFLTRVAADHPNPATKEAAAALNKLLIGKVAPDIAAADTEGKELKLSDYRGKVVLLVFWGHWCPPCRAMIPHQRSLVKRLENAPFALIGVNSDKDKELIKKQNEVEQVSWRSFSNSHEGTNGPISKLFGIRAWPTLYLIDHQGGIRHRWIGNPGDGVLDREIDALVAKARK